MLSSGVEIGCKKAEDVPKLESLDFRLKMLLDFLSLYAADRLVYYLTITDVDTPEIHIPASAHYDRRAIDIRLQPLGLKNLEEWAEYINALFKYPNHRVALVGRTDPTHQHNDHLHLQVPGPYRAEGRISL